VPVQGAVWELSRSRFHKRGPSGGARPRPYSTNMLCTDRQLVCAGSRSPPPVPDHRSHQDSDWRLSRKWRAAGVRLHDRCRTRTRRTLARALNRSMKGPRFAPGHDCTSQTRSTPQSDPMRAGRTVAEPTSERRGRFRCSRAVAFLRLADLEGPASKSLPFSAWVARAASSCGHLHETEARGRPCRDRDQGELSTVPSVENRARTVSSCCEGKNFQRIVGHANYSRIKGNEQEGPAPGSPDFLRVADLARTCAGTATGKTDKPKITSLAAGYSNPPYCRDFVQG